MKKVFSILTSYLLAFIIMTAGSGFMISQMVCLSSGYSSFSLTKQIDCCEGEEAPISFEEVCCDFVNVVFTPQQFLETEKAFIADHVINAELFVSHLFTVPVTDKANTTFYCDTSPPPLYGKDLLFMYRTLLI